MKLIGFYDYTVLLTYGSVVSAVMGMVQASIPSKASQIPQTIRQRMAAVKEPFDACTMPMTAETTLP